MVRIFGVVIACCARSFRSLRDLLLENLALRQQLSLMVRKRPRRRPTLRDKLFRSLLSRIWSGWKRTILIVQPKTVPYDTGSEDSVARGSCGMQSAAAPKAADLRRSLLLTLFAMRSPHDGTGDLTSKQHFRSQSKTIRCGAWRGNRLK